MLAAGSEILPGVGLSELSPGVVPLFAEGATAANVRDRQHAAALQPGQADRIVAHGGSESIRAVSGKERRMRAVANQILPTNDRQWHLNAVVAGDHYFRGSQPLGRIEFPLGRQAGVGQLARGW